MTWEKVTQSPASSFVWTLPVNSDNFAYLVYDKSSKEAAVVDGAEPEPVLKLLEQLGASLKYILTTHHHLDHAGGNAELKRRWPNAITVDQNNVGNNIYMLGESIKITGIHTPVHTMDHICYYCVPLEKAGEAPFVFTGDFLFRCGCGYYFEGKPEDFDQSVRRLYDNCNVETTLMYFGHEYCEPNFKFARSIDPDNMDLQQAEQRVLAIKPASLRTPSTLKDELAFNPFIRAVLRPESLSEHHRKTARNSKMLLCGYLRELKNRFGS